MLPSAYYCGLVFIIISSDILLINVFGNAKSDNFCIYPEIYSVVFDDENVVSQKPPELHIINSTRDLKVPIKFPYQYILMTCSAPYPIEWAGDGVPQHYYFSYVLDDEIRSTTVQSEMWTIRLHIGNETLSKGMLNDLSVICQPVADGGCGLTVISIKKYNDALFENKTMLQMQFSQIPLEESIPTGDLENEAYTLCSKEQEEKMSQCNQTWAGENEFSRLNYERSCNLDSEIKLNKTSLIHPSGIITCKYEGHVSKTPYLFSLPKFCPTEDITLPHIYYGRSLSGQFNPNLLKTDFLSLCVQNASIGDVYVGDTVTVTCISSIYYFARGTLIQLVYPNQQSVLIGWERAFGPGGYRNLTTSFVVESSEIQTVKCSAPVRKSKKWIVKSVDLKPKVSVKVTFQNTPDIAISDASGASYLSCNASGDPLPKLFWSRLNNQQLPSNQTTIRNEIGNTSSWISSTLHFPNVPATNLSKYYGRYICTASNKFDSIEKVFLFDDKNNQDSVSIFGEYTFAKTAWFWIMAGSAMLTLVVTVIWLGWKLRKQAQKVRLFSKAEIDEFLFGKPELLLEDADMYTEMNSYADYLPYDTHQFEIDREQLDFNPVDILGTGAYGTVYKGTFKTSYGKIKTVAIKTVNPSSDKMYFAALLSEIKIMCFIGKHANVVRFIGACTKYLDQRQLLVATEFCPNGDLLSYILKHRDTFINNSNLVAHKEAKDSVANGTYCKLTYSNRLLSPHLLLFWSLQIAQGMNYLSSKKVIHGDLAARNVLLAGDLKPKIADFGLSKQLQKYANYVRKGDDLVPWRWLAVECLQFMKFSIQSDVWAMGVVLFEIFSLGQVPYGSHTYSELFIVSLCQGERLHRPEYASDKLYGLMLECWNHSPENRPSFSRLEDELRIMVNESESKMLMSISNNSLQETNTNGVVHPTNVQQYVNNELHLHNKRNSIDDGIVQRTTNGYVTNLETSTSYVNHSEFPPASHTTTSYIDWTAVST